MTPRFALACASIFAISGVLGHALATALGAQRPEPRDVDALVPSTRAPAPVDAAATTCIEDRRALASAERALADRRRATATLAADRPTRARDDTADRRELEARFTAVIERSAIEGLSVDCEESPCLVLGAGTRDVVEPLADAIAGDPAFADLRAVVVSRSVVDRDRAVDTVSALALMPRDEYDDATARDAFEATLRGRLGRLQR